MSGSGMVGQALAIVVGALLVLFGLAAIGVEGETRATGVWLVIFGLVLVVAALVERRRYRSDSAERSGLPIGPGGGEPTGQPLEGRFQRTEERFVDPTSGHTMRVWLDRQSGERRYVAED